MLHRLDASGSAAMMPSWLGQWVTELPEQPSICNLSFTHRFNKNILQDQFSIERLNNRDYQGRAFWYFSNVGYLLNIQVETAVNMQNLKLSSSAECWRHSFVESSTDHYIDCIKQENSHVIRNLLACMHCIQTNARGMDHEPWIHIEKKSCFLRLCVHILCDDFDTQQGDLV